MDSLLASYASSDEDDDQKESKSSNPVPSIQSKSTTKTLFSSLPPPKSSSSSSSPSLLFSLPPPKSHLPNPASISSPSSSPLISSHSTERQQSVQNMETTTKLSASLPKTSTSLFSSLPQPKSSSASSLFSSIPQPKTHSNTDALHSSPVVPAKRVVQFRPPPMNPPSSSSAGSDDEDENDEDEEDKQKKKQETIQTSSVKSFLSSIPAPRNSATLGVSSSSSGTGRRSIIDADVPGLKNSNVVGTAMDNEAGVSTHGGYYESQSGVDQASISSSAGVSESSGYAVGGGGAGADYSSWTSGSENYAGYGGYVGYDGVSGDYQNGDYMSYNNGNDANYGQYESNWADDSTPSVVPEGSGLAESAFKLSGKRGRNDVPQVIVEVKQDELIKNRPREDQVKLTGIAFGPSYQPASTKGKPSKLHKRKHQIGSLFFDMKQKETELAERRARGFLTKAQTQGKYGWKIGVDPRILTLVSKQSSRVALWRQILDRNL